MTDPQPRFTTTTNPNVKRVRDALIDASAANGHDFGFIDEAWEAVRGEMSQPAFAGCVGALRGCGDFFEWAESVRVNGTLAGIQFELTPAAIQFGGAEAYDN